MLRFMGQFKGLLLELRTKQGKYDYLIQKYGALTGENCSNNNGFFIRKNSGWENSYETKVYFNASDDVIASMRKLGINVYSNNFSIEKYQGNLEQYPYCFSNTYWFWKFVEYGYRLDNNDNIPYELHLMRKSLKEKKIQDDNCLFEINHIESENVIDEARILLSLAS